jgi:hypothetical protein
MDEMRVAKSVVLAVNLMLAASTFAQAASRRDRSASFYNNSYRTYGATSPASPPTAPSSYGGYSADLHTRALQELADKYRPGW